MYSSSETRFDGCFACSMDCVNDLSFPAGTLVSAIATVAALLTGSLLGMYFELLFSSFFLTSFELVSFRLIVSALTRLELLNDDS